MADIPGWLRGFQRARTANVITPSDRLSLPGEVNEAPEEIQGAPSTARMSSCRNFGRLAASSLSAEGQPHLNQVEQIWHNPDTDQMAETLKVAMMTQNSFDPLHVPYNSCILHVLEAYHHMRMELIEKDHELQDRERRHERDIKEFLQQQARWKGKEDEYKSELKKLEVMLATGARGLELVTLARSRSALNGTINAGAIENQQLEKQSELQNVENDQEPMMSDFAERKDSFLSARYTSQKRMSNASHSNGAFILRWPQQSEPRIVSGQPNGGTKYDNKNNNATSDTNLLEQLLPMANGDTRSDSLSRLEQESQRSTEQHARPLNSLISNRTYVEQDQKIKDGNKLLPEVSISLNQISAKDSNEEEEEEEAGPYYGEDNNGRSVIHHARFSFIPGDDYGRLALGRVRTQAAVLALNGYRNRRRPSSSYLSTSNDFIDLVAPKIQRRTRPVLGEWEEVNPVSDSQPSPACELAPRLSDLQNHIITAVPDRNAGSSKCSDSFKAAPSRPKPSRLSGSNVAIIAAVRAISESGKIASKAPLI